MPADLSRNAPRLIETHEYEGYDIDEYEGESFDIYEGNICIERDFGSLKAAQAYIEDNLLPVETVSAALSRPSKRDIGYLADVARRGRAA